MAKNQIELVYAKDIIPKLTFVPNPYCGYPKNYVKEWREHLIDVWSNSNAIGLKRMLYDSMVVLAHPEDRWFTTKDAAIKWARLNNFEVVNEDIFV